MLSNNRMQLKADSEQPKNEKLILYFFRHCGLQQAALEISPRWCHEWHLTDMCCSHLQRCPLSKHVGGATKQEARTEHCGRLQTEGSICCFLSSEDDVRVVRPAWKINTWKRGQQYRKWLHSVTWKLFSHSFVSKRHWPRLYVKMYQDECSIL